jgi:hypothetical protein
MAISIVRPLSDQDARVDDNRITEQRLLRERRNDVRDDPEGRQDQDVDLRMAEDPEEVLPEDGIAAAGRLEEQRSEHAVEQEEDRPDRERRERQDDEERDNQRHPGEERKPHERKAGRPQIDDSDDKVQCGDDGGRAREGEAEDVEVHPVTRRELTRREVGIREPARIRCSAEEEAGVEKQRAEQEEPVGEGVEPRKSDISGTHLERNDVVEGTGGHRHDRKEHHRQPVHREQLIVRFGAEHIVAGHGELKSDEHRLQTTDQEEEQTGHEIQDPDPLVIHGGDPAPKAASVEAASLASLLYGRVRRRHRRLLQAQ